jgi:hypothetical protein
LRHVAPELACSIANRAMLPEVRVLARSFRQHHPHTPFLVLIADDMPAGIEREPFEAIALEEVGIPDELCWSAGAQQLSYLATPYLLRTLLACGAERIVFFKQETVVCSSARRIFDQLRDSPIFLAPHLTRPHRGADAAEIERLVLCAGAFNVGVLGVATDEQAHAFLDWWCERVAFDSEHALERGVHFEQRWLTLAPSLFDRAHVDRSPGTNIGHWSIPAIDVRFDEAGVLRADSDPVIALRFSGYDGDRTSTYSRHAPRLDGEDLGDLDGLLAAYGEALHRAGHATRDTAYRFDGARA